MRPIVSIYVSKFEIEVKQIQIGFLKTQIFLSTDHVFFKDPSIKGENLTSFKNK